MQQIIIERKQNENQIKNKGKSQKNNNTPSKGKKSIRSSQRIKDNNSKVASNLNAGEGK